MQQFTATVSNTSNTAASWSVNGIPGGNSAVGTVSAGGLYTAPTNLPSPAVVAVQATSQADTSKSASATITIASDVVVSVTPTAADVELGAMRQFQANLAGSGNPNRAVTWSISGAGCSGVACGTVQANGVFTAPQIRPSPASVTLTAKSDADPSKTASATISVTSSFTLSVSGPSSVATGGTAVFTATLTPAPNSNPSTAIAWSVSGAGCSGATCGTIAATGANTASYTAPASAPSPNNISISATPAADSAKTASVTVMITPAAISVAVQISPTSAMLAVTHRQTFSVQVSGTSNQNVQWQVNAAVSGNTTVGQICAVGTSPCQSVSTTNGAADYVAPASVPTSNPVTVTAVSQADPSRSASAQVTILAHIVVVVAPPSATLAPRGTQQFTAAVQGTSNQNITWQISGTGCAGAGSPCGTVDATGFYLAPSSPPTPNTLNVVATSAEDTARSGNAQVTISAGASINALLPASITAGAAGGFTLKVQGSGFGASSPDPGSTILFNAAARTTNCSTASECTTTLAAADVAAAGSVPIQIRNSDSTTSNQVSFVVVAPGTSDDVISLSAAAPNATGKDIVVVEPSTAGTSSDLNLNIVAIGFFSVTDNACNLANSPLALPRPASGTTNFEICAFSLSGLDPALTYTITGPSPNDTTIVAKQPLGLGIIHLTLQVPSNAQVGPRTLFVENSNKDKSAVSGTLEVK